MDYERKLGNFLDVQGRLVSFPSKRKMKILALFYLAEKLEAQREYTEKELNAAINELTLFGDPATVRRELYDNRFVDRKRDGSAYWLQNPQPQPQPKALGLGED